MIKLDSEFSQAIEEVVGSIETRTDAEVVVVANLRSDAWPELGLRAALLVTGLVLSIVVWSPWTFHVGWLPLELLVLGWVSAWAVKTSPRALRLLIGRQRIRARVEESAAAAFHTEAVHSTRGRTGVLVFLSCLEERVVLIADAGVEGRVPGGLLHTIHWGRDSDLHRSSDLASLVEGLQALGEVLADHIPPLDDNPDELSNAPRIRS